MGKAKGILNEQKFTTNAAVTALRSRMLGSPQPGKGYNFDAASILMIYNGLVGTVGGNCREPGYYPRVVKMECAAEDHDSQRHGFRTLCTILTVRISLVSPKDGASALSHGLGEAMDEWRQECKDKAQSAVSL